MEKERETKALIKELLNKQLFCVLSTKLREGNYPYSSLIGYQVSEDLKQFFFITSRNTTKFTNLLSEPNACIFVDNRSNHEEDVLNAKTVTILGIVEEIEKEPNKEIIEKFKLKYPQIKEFIDQPSTALLRFNVKQYIVVYEFQKVLRLEIP